MNPIDNLIQDCLGKVYRPNLTNTQLREALEDLAYKAKAQGIAEIGNEIQSLLARELMKCVEDEI